VRTTCNEPEQIETMTSDHIVRALARLPLFKGLTMTQLNAIARRADHVLFHPGAVILEENTEGDAAILIIAGDAVRVSGSELKARLEPIPPGSLLGETAMLVEATFGSTVVARNHVRALRIGRTELHAQMLDDPLIADTLVQNIAQRLSRLANELRQVDALLAESETEEAAGLANATSRVEQADLPAPAN
jgi:CRP/FNR family cyclic AMP-dependent transcriptional regulator